MPYGMTENSARCINAEPGTYNHECGKPAQWIGTKKGGFEACYCDDCKQHGYEALNCASWRTLPR